MKQKISKFLGSKDDLVKLIQGYEKQFPEHFLLRRKKTGEEMPTNSRRVQQFCDEGIIPRAKSKDGNDSFRGLPTKPICCVSCGHTFSKIWSVKPI